MIHQDLTNSALMMFYFLMLHIFSLKRKAPRRISIATEMHRALIEVKKQLIVNSLEHVNTEERLMYC